MNYISITYNQVTNINNQKYILMHAYVVEDFKRVPILVNIKQITKGQTHPWWYH
jgi:hypothetical protein